MKYYILSLLEKEVSHKIKPWNVSLCSTALKHINTCRTIVNKVMGGDKTHQHPHSPIVRMVIRGSGDINMIVETPTPNVYHGMPPSTPTKNHTCRKSLVIDLYRLIIDNIHCKSMVNNHQYNQWIPTKRCRLSDTNQSITFNQY